MFVCRPKGLLEKWFAANWRALRPGSTQAAASKKNCWRSDLGCCASGFNETCFGFCVFAWFRMVAERWQASVYHWWRFWKVPRKFEFCCGPRIPEIPTNGSRGGSSFWNQGLVTQSGHRELQVVFQEIDQRLNFQRQVDLHLRDWVRRSEPDLPTFVWPWKVNLPPVAKESMRNGTSSIAVKSGFLVHPKVITIAGEPEKMKYWGWTSIFKNWCRGPIREVWSSVGKPLK